MRVASGEQELVLVRGRTRLVPFLFLDNLDQPMDLDGYELTLTIAGPASNRPTYNYWQGNSVSLSPCFTGLTLTNRTQTGANVGYADWDPLSDGSGYTTKGTIEELKPGLYLAQFVYTVGGREDRAPEDPGGLWLRITPRLDAN